MVEDPSQERDSSITTTDPMQRLPAAVLHKLKPNRATHFLSLPISDPECHRRAQEIVDVLLNADPRPEGVHESLAVHPRSLHLTLGIMSLVGSRAASRHLSAAASSSDAQPAPSGVAPRGPVDGSKTDSPAKLRQEKLVKYHTVDDAASVLHSCRAGVLDILRRGGNHNTTSDTASLSPDDGSFNVPIVVHFDKLSTFQSDPSKCRVLYAEPDPADAGTRTLHEIGEYVRQEFLKHRMLADAGQPLTLHCTLMKASARTNRPNGGGGDHRPAESNDKASDKESDKDDGREGTSAGLLPSAPNAASQGPKRSPTFGNPGSTSGDNAPRASQTDKPQAQKKKRTRPRARFPKAYAFDATLVLDPAHPQGLGRCTIDRIQLCQMGRRDETGAYEVLGQISLFEDDET